MIDCLRAAVTNPESPLSREAPEKARLTSGLFLLVPALKNQDTSLNPGRHICRRDGVVQGVGRTQDCRSRHETTCLVFTYQGRIRHCKWGSHRPLRACDLRTLQPAPPIEVVVKRCARRMRCTFETVWSCVDHLNTFRLAERTERMRLAPSLYSVRADSSTSRVRSASLIWYVLGSSSTALRRFAARIRSRRGCVSVTRAVTRPQARPNARPHE